MGTNILDLKGRIGLVTGAGQGVGRSVALRFAENNAGGVVVNDFRMERAEAVAAEVEKLGVKALRGAMRRHRFRVGHRDVRKGANGSAASIFS